MDQRVSTTESRVRVAVVVPCYRVAGTIATVLAGIGPEVDHIVCVDDACPEGSGEAIAAAARVDARIRLLRHETNRGVGAATCTGYRAAIEAGADVIVKIDGDGQMDPRLIPSFVAPIAAHEADYVKGNRFFSIETVRQMRAGRLLGNAGLSFLSKLSSGYWDLFDPTNGYTAIEARVAAELPLARLHPRFFFESDLLFRLGTLRARVIELPLAARYGEERSNLSVVQALVTFPWLHLRNFGKRVLYGYFLRGFSVASLNLVLGLALAAFGAGFGALRWSEVNAVGQPATAGTVMLAALPILIGLQMLLAFLAHDMSMVPREPVHPRLRDIRVLRQDGAAMPSPRDERPP